MFDWRATIESKGTLVTDSLCKWVKDLSYLDVQACPGLRLDTALANMKSGLVQVQGYEFLILAVGTNHVNARGTNIQQVMTLLTELINYINKISPFTTIAISSILPRPQDKDVALDIYRRTINVEFKRFCKLPGRGLCSFLKSWSKVEDEFQQPILSLYAEDRLHFNKAGAMALKEYYDGAMGHVMDLKYSTE
jgi:lysophospholipase L1-like esterase